MKKLFLLVIVLFAVGCNELSTIQDPPNPDGNPIRLQGLKSFNDCDEVKDFLADLGDSGNYAVPLGGTDFAEAEDAAGSDAAIPTAQPTVEQADIVKQFGNYLYILNSQAGLIIYDVSDPASPLQTAHRELSINPREIYVTESKLVIIGTGVSGRPSYYQADKTHISIYDISDPQNPDMIREWSFPGYYGNSRRVGTSVYLVLNHWTGLNRFDELAESEETCQNTYAPERLIDEPIYNVIVHKIVGIDLLNVQGSHPEEAIVLGTGSSEMTASPSRLYLTHYRYDSDETQVFVFELNDRGNRVRPVASTEVPGVIVNQFSMDEYDEHFRIASTTNRTTFGAADNRNFLTVYEFTDEGMIQVGQNGEITPGESITAVRFIGERAYITTYVTKDPLLTVDLSDPANPIVRGELDVPGYAHHLHPWGEDRLISIGSAQEFWGEVVLSLFDLSDFANPTLIEQISLQGTSSSEAQGDHRALSFFEDLAILALPVQVAWSSSEIALFQLSDDGFTELGSVNHDDLIEGETYGQLNMRRSLNFGNYLYTISEGGLEVHHFDDLTTALFAELFPGYETPIYDCYYAGDGCSCDCVWIDDVESVDEPIM